MDKIGPYQILEMLHSMPRPLYKVKAADGRLLALKAVPVAGLSAESRERFTREAETCRALDHPNLVRVFEMGEADGMLYQAMELLEGVDLGKAMAEGRQFSWHDKLLFMKQVCDGLQFAHDRKLVHRDIKPANIFLENSGRVRVLDFGMVRVEESELTKVGASVGTLNYMSPEQIRGERCTAASDVFSAGIVFFQVATGRHPFSTRDRSLAQVVSAIVFETPPKLSELCPDAPPGLEALLNRALEKDPAKRPQNAGEFKQGVASQSMAAKVESPVLAAAPTVDAEKTRVMAKAAAPAGSDEDKTRVMKRSVPVPASPAAPSPIAAVKKAKAPTTTNMPAVRYCPACAAVNPMDTTECRNCATPWPVSRGVEAKATPWGLYVAIAVAILLAIALVVVLVVKR